MERKTLFVDVLLPLRLPGTYTYRIPQEYNDAIAVGQRVVVQFGAKRLYSALVRRVHGQAPAVEAKYILSILDASPIVNERQFELWEWMARYYMCTPGEVMAVALPSSLRLASESFIAIHPKFTGDYGTLTPQEAKIVDALNAQQVISVSQVSTITGSQKVMPVLKTMIEKHIIVMEEELQQRFVPRLATWLELAEEYRSEAAQKELFDKLERRANSQKQLAVMLRFMQCSSFGQKAIKKRQLTDLPDLSLSALNTLIGKGVLVPFERAESRLEEYDATSDPLAIQLNDEQQAALDTIMGSSKRVSLLHGVTSSGKTEVYIKLIAESLRQGGQAILLLPEIALSAQLINRLRKYFGKRVGIYHSRFSANERAEVWNKTMDASNDGYDVIVGPRSALFLPYHDLRLVIVDEEHDPSYKQAEPAPRYNGRDTAIYLATMWGAQVVLGSATPSLESYYNATNGKYTLATIMHRYGGVNMPEVRCVDMKAAAREKMVRLNFSEELLEQIGRALDNKEQVILFQNRRGFALRLECEQCHWVPQCAHCDVSLVYHKSTGSLRCHYCGYSIPVPSECPACHSTALRMKGIGTERIEDDLAILFPNAKVARMDLDSTMQKKRHAEIISDFEEHRIDILVGTQMVTKGLDFDNVGIVGIISADNMVSYPDFRAFERSYQQMTQVSGRAGRHGRRGRVLIQSYNPGHQVIRDVMSGNYQSMYNSQINERRVFRYPPFYKLVEVYLRHREQQPLNEAAADYANALRQHFGGRVLGPEFPNVARVRNLYIKKIMVRFDRTECSAGKLIMWNEAEKLLATKSYGKLLLHFDVDPQ
ncbi:MAG: primosomal protein N' [Bacteroidales bacterium]|nr:primosomal protein N' [Bacteroidales bacterium]